MKLKNYFLLIVLLMPLVNVSSCGQNSFSKMDFSYSSATTNDYKNTTYYTDDYFIQSSTTYNPSLATASLCMAMASFASNNNSNSNDYSYRYKNVDKFFNNFGYNTITPNNDYLKKPEADTLGVVYAKKEITNFTMIAIGLRGAGYQGEWASNFKLGKFSDNSYHQGFYEGAENVLNGLKKYLLDNNITGNIKIWISGYSRGGAVANVTAGILDKSLIEKTNLISSNKATFKKEDIYAYTFEAPQGAYYDSSLNDVEVKGENYNNIFNIVNPNDIVPKVAMNCFGFARFGVDLFLSSSFSDPNYANNINKIKSIYSKTDNYSSLWEDYFIDKFEYMNFNVDKENRNLITKDSYHKNWTQAFFAEEFINTLSLQGVGSRDSYAASFQEGLRNLFIILYKSDTPKSSLTEFGINFAKKLLSSGYADLLMDDLLHNQDYFVKDLSQLLQTALKEIGIIISISMLINNLDNLLEAIVKVFQINQSLIISFFSGTNVKALGSAHFPELCLANMQALDPCYSNDYLKYDLSGRYYYFESLDFDKEFSIYKDNNLVIQAKKGTIVDLNTPYTYGIDNSKFVAYFPIDGGYKIKMSSGTSANISIYEPSKLRFINSFGTIDSSKHNNIIDGNIQIDFQ